MNKNEILKYIKKKVNSAELPSKMDVSIIDQTLFITMDAEGVLQNMQNDASSFEGWIFCLKAFFSDIRTVVIDWEKPAFSTDEKEIITQKKHYNRFLLRVIWFIDNYSWATMVEHRRAEILCFQRRFCHLTLNFPRQKSKDKREKSEADQIMKYEAILETAIYQHLSTTSVANHQLPMGLFDGQVLLDTAITPGGASQADLWKIEKDEFCVYELKDSIHTDNIRVGIITELMFYANVLHRLFITKEIQYPLEADLYRTNNRDNASRGFEYILDAIYQHSITHIKAVMLTDRLHPLIEHNKEQLLNDMSQNKVNIRYEHLTILQLLPPELIPIPSYKEVQGGKQALVLQTSPHFVDVHSRGKWTDSLTYVIQEGKELMNLYPTIREEAIDYFRQNGIGWWKSNDALNTPTGNMLSSQISCVNHLFPLMKPNKSESASLLSMLNSIQERYNFIKILANPLDNNNSNGNLCFEFIWKNRTLLGENYEIRGAMCTSIDAIVYAETDEHKRILIPIEWKYTETYKHRRALQSSIDRYISRLDNSSNIKEWKEEYEYDPLYELVRQTMLVEGIIKNKDAKLPVDDYLHINVIPEGNVELRSEISLYPEGLKDKNKFIIVDPRKLMEPIKDTHTDLYNYLETRYWQ
jgi:hypothetical protein